MKAVNALTEKEIRSCIEGEAEEQVACVYSVTVAEMWEQGLDVCFESVQIANAVLDELRSNELTRVVPLAAIGREDAVAEKIVPFFPESLTLAIVLELGSKNSFDVLRILWKVNQAPPNIKQGQTNGCEEHPSATSFSLNGVRVASGMVSPLVKHIYPHLEVPVLHPRHHHIVDQVNPIRPPTGAGGCMSS